MTVAPSGIRTGIGIDAHQYGDSGPCHLAGLEWPEARALVGHSDGDAVVHAICDALLSASKLGDVGAFFGVDRPEWANGVGVEMLGAVASHIASFGYSVINVSVQVMGNEPKISPRRTEAEQVLSEVLGAPVSVGATTSDGMGFTGRGEGVFVVASALLERTEGAVK